MARKILVVLVLLLVLIIGAGIGLNWWVDKRLPDLISQKNQSGYHITYRDLDVSLWARKITATDILLVPKQSLAIKDQVPGFYADVQKLEISGVGITSLVFGDRISANSLTLYGPHLTIVKDTRNKKRSAADEVKPLDKIIRVANLNLIGASLSMRQLGRALSILDVHNATIKLDGITVSDATLAKKIPFTCKTYSLVCDSLSYRPSAVYELRTKAITTAPDGLKINQLTFKPRVSRQAFNQMIKMEKDLFDVQTRVMALDKLQWGYRDDQLCVSLGTLFVDGLNAKIYRSKTVADDPKKKKFYSQQLREIGFPLDVGLLQLKNSRISYEEEKDKDDGPGKLVFGNFNLKATGIASGFGQQEIPDVNIAINCRFMDVAPFDVKWRFNALDKTDGFNITGHIRDFPSSALIPFTRPYVNAEFKGKLDQVRFDFAGNDDRSAGTFSLEHSDFKVTILKKDKRKNKIVSAIANLFVKNDSNEKPKKVEVSVDREKDKSFFNLLWKSVSEGLKKTLL